MKEEKAGIIWDSTLGWDTMSLCKKCGKPRHLIDKFCPNCGVEADLTNEGFVVAEVLKRFPDNFNA